MAKRPAEDDNISSINQYVGGNVSSNGDYNITNSVVNYNAGVILHMCSPPSLILQAF
jgi:hypothetical protein